MLDKILIVFKKELVDCLRDYKALIPALLLALLLGPLTVCLTPQVVAMQLKSTISAPIVVALAGDGANLYKRLEADKGVTVTRIADDKDSFDKLLASGKYQVILRVNGAFRAALESYESASTVSPADNSAPAVTSDKKDTKAGLPQVQLFYTGLHPLSFFAMGRLTKVITNLSDDFYDQRIKSVGIVVERVPTVDVQVIAPPTEGPFASAFMSKTLSSILIFIAFLGAVYPALDLLTGERERHTMEALILTPTSRRAFFAGKLLCIAFVSFAFVLLTLAGFYTCQFFQPELPASIPFPLVCRLPLSCTLATAALMLPLCLTLSVGVLAMAGLARTVQQAQGYLTSFAIFLFAPLGLSALHMSFALACVPFLGALVAINDLLEARVDYGLIALTVSVSMLFVSLLVAVVSPVMEREDLLWGSEESPARRYQEGKFGLELFLLCATVFLLMFYVSQTLVLQHHIWGLLATQILVVLAPCVCLVFFWLKLPARQVFALGAPRGGLLSCISAALISPLTVSGALGLAALQSKVLPDTKSLEKLMEQILGLGKEPLWLLILVIALSPAICEELLFRGTIYAFLQKRFTPVKLTFVVGGLFGLFHMSTIRFLPTALAGILLTFVRYRSGSIYPCMCLHFCHNALSILMAAKLKDDMQPQYLIIGFAAGLVALLSFVYLTRSDKR